MSAELNGALAPMILRLTIERFRGISSLTWRPKAGVNVILGGGDVGKTTILDAIALLLSPVNTTNLSDTDYYARDVDAGFCIEAVLGLPTGSGISDQLNPSWPWEWDGNDVFVPAIEGEGKRIGSAAYRVRVRGTEELDIYYEIVQPDGSIDSFPAPLRRSIGLVRLGGDDKNDRDLRLVQGSALDRLLSDKGLRSRMVSELAKNDVREELTEKSQRALTDLDTAFKKESLPSGLDLSLTGGQGPSIASLVGLTADRIGIKLPLASWGSGTRRLSALTIAAQNQGENPITIVDEVERGLEPYRQRALIGKLQDAKCQVFMTTHSPPAISAASSSALWYVDHASQIGPLDSEKTANHRRHDPEAFLARLTIVAEGATEVGFVAVLLQRALGSRLEHHGIHISDGFGHESTLVLLEALAEAGLRFGGFADDEGKYPGRWKKVSDKLGELLFRWPSKSLDENVISLVPDDKIEELIADPSGEMTGTRLRTLAYRLNVEDKTFASLKAAAGDRLRELIIEAALGLVPAGKDEEKNQYKSHAGIWFKSRLGGRELAGKVRKFGLWPLLRPQLLPFCNAVRKAIALPTIADLPE